MTIFIGTSGYSYDDWKGKFYPPLAKSSEMLPFYAKFFRMTEINSSYYRIPPRQMMQHILEKVSDDFLFTVKAFKGITHERIGDVDALAAEFNASIAPLVEAGQLALILLQFPYSFRNDEGNRNYILDLKEKFPVPIAVEFRNSEWVQEEVFQMLELAKISYCCVDEPKMKGLMPPEARVTSDFGYLRFHGRNAEKWFSKEGPAERYDYLYAEHELHEWVGKIKTMASLTQKFFVLFNNHPKAYAVRNAALLAKMLDIPMPKLPTEDDYDSSLNKFL
ncbi:MAG: DUF72 domain-containing protein [Nanoarchaeota archaeon]